MREDVAERLARETADFGSTMRAPGMAVMIRRDGQELFSAYLGVADAFRRTPTTSQTRFGLGSITKQFTAAAILRLQESGALDIDEPVSTYLSGLATLMNAPRLRHLLGHTGGLRSALEGAMVTGGPQDAPSLSMLVDELVRRSDHVPPGTKWQYCNTGYFLLGHVVEQTSGMTLRAYERLHLLERAALPSVFRSTPPTDSRDALGHIQRAEGFASVAPPDPRFAFGSGDLYASAATLASWQETLWGEDLLSASSRALMSRAGELADGTATQYGLGTYVAHFEGHSELSHDGNAAGFSSQVAWYPDSRLSVAVLINCQTHVAEHLEKRLSACVLGVGRRSTTSEVPHGVPLLPYVGDYSYGVHRVTVEGCPDGLLIHTPTGRRAMLCPLGEHCFAEAGDPAMRYVFLVENGSAESFRVERLRKVLGVAERTGAHHGD